MAEKGRILAATNNMIAKMLLHDHLLSQMVSVMHMVATSRFWYSAQLVLWTDAEQDKLHAKWLQVHSADWRLPTAHVPQCRRRLGVQ
jgi:hypothetical protein